MKKIALCCGMLIFIFISCKKNSSTTNNASDVLSGNWQFTGMTAHTQSSDQYAEGGDNFEDITIADFTTDSNGGTVSFSGGTATSTAITYSVATTAFVSSYEDGVLVDTFSSPFAVTIPASNSVSTYKIIGSDSVYFPSGFVSSSALTGGTAQASTPGGFRFSIAGSVLTMSTVFVKDTVEILSGISTQVDDSAAYSLTLKKQ